MSMPIAYSGDESYIFISYSHRDSKVVLPIITRLMQQGYRVWYDSGIDPGSEWDENIASHIDNCSYFIAMMSKSYLDSSNCKDELNYARDLEKDRLVVYLEDVQLPSGMAMRVNRLQSLFKYAYNDEETFYSKLFEAQNIEKCLNAPAVVETPAPAPTPTPAPASASAPAQHTVPAKEKGKKVPLGLVLGIAGGAAVIIVLVIILLVSLLSGGNNDRGNDDYSSQSAVVTMSDNLLDFTVELDGDVIKLPCSLEALTREGWTISESGVTDDVLVAGKEDVDCDMAKNGQTITVTFYNPSGNATKIKDCLVAGLFVYGDEVNIALPKGITADSTEEEIIAAYGAPNDRNDGSAYNRLSYYGEDEDISYVTFRISLDSEEPNVITICNAVSNGVTTETSTEVPDYLSNYKAPTSQAKNLAQPVVSVEGDLYRLPAPLSEFTGNGWSITQKPGSVPAGGQTDITLKKGDKKIGLKICNAAEYQTIPENCLVYSIYVYDYDKTDISIAGVGIGSDKSAVEKAITEDFEINDYTDLTYYYSEDDLYISVDVDKTTNKVNKIYVKNENLSF